MSNDVVYEKVVSAQIKNLNSGSASEFPDTFNEISVASVQELFSKLTENFTETLQNQNVITQATKYRIANATTGTFLGFDIVTSYKEEGILQATITAITASGVGTIAGITIGAFAGAISMPAMTTLLATCLAAGVTATYVGNWIDEQYDLTEEQWEIYKSNQTDDFILETNSQNMDNIKTVADAIFDADNSGETNLDVNNFSIVQKTDNSNIKYTIKKGDTVWDICQKYGLTYNELIDANPWLADRFSDDMEFALIRPEEQLRIPENVLRESTTHNESFETVRDIYTGEKSPSDLINYEIPEDSEFYVPQGGESQEITYQYPQAPAANKYLNKVLCA